MQWFRPPLDSHFGDSGMTIQLPARIAPLALISLCLSSCGLITWYSDARLQEDLGTATPVQVAVQEICGQFPSSESELVELVPGAEEGYVSLGGNDHIIVWMDASGDAIWFDIADSLSSFGYVCTRKGSDPQDAINGFDRLRKDRDIFYVRDNLFYWR